MKIMDSRYSQLEDAMRGLNATDVPLVSLHEGAYFPSGYTDDLGVYYFIPKLAKAFGLSLDSTITLFFSSLLLIGAAVSLSCFFCMF
mgnify:FL=1